MGWKIAAGCGIWKVYLGPSIEWSPLGNGGVVATKRQVHQQMTCIIFVSTIQRRKIFCNEFTTFELLVLTLIPKIPKVSTPPPPPLPPILCRQPIQTKPMGIWPSSMPMGIWTLPGWNGKFEVEVSLGLSSRIQVLYI